MLAATDCLHHFNDHAVSDFGAGKLAFWGELAVNFYSIASLAECQLIEHQLYGLVGGLKGFSIDSDGAHGVSWHGDGCL